MIMLGHHTLLNIISLVSTRRNNTGITFCTMEKHYNKAQGGRGGGSQNSIHILSPYRTSFIAHAHTKNELKRHIT